MSTDATLSTAYTRRSYRCYNCNDAFHITTTTSGMSSSFRCPRCFHRHLLPNYTIATTAVTPPSQSNFTPPTTTNSFTFDYSDSDTDTEDGTDSDDLSFELFNSTQFRSPTLKSVMDSLPSVKVYESYKSCPICMEEFVVDSEASQLPCHHLFHNDCIVPWLNRSNTCPLCRHKLPPEDEDDIEKDLEVILNGEIGQDNSVVLVSTTPSRSLDLRERDPEEIRDEDGDILMVDASSSN